MPTGNLWRTNLAALLASCIPPVSTIGGCCYQEAHLVAALFREPLTVGSMEGSRSPPDSLVGLRPVASFEVGVVEKPTWQPCYPDGTPPLLRWLDGGVKKPTSQPVVADEGGAPFLVAKKGPS